MRPWAIILGRAGSKGLPHKNVLPVAGRPCVAWTIDAARRARPECRVALSTDSPEMASIARAMQAEVIERPPELASDSARIDDAARHAASALDCATPAPPDHPIVLLYANVPVRPPGLIDRALAMLIDSGCDSVQSYAAVGKFHPWWTARLEDGRVRPWEGDVLNHGIFRRQDLPPAFVPDGGVIALTRRALFLEAPGALPGPHAFFGSDRRGIVSGSPVVDIDDAMDRRVAETVLADAARGGT